LVRAIVSWTFVVVTATTIAPPVGLAQDAAPAEPQELTSEDATEKLKIPADWKMTFHRVASGSEQWQVALPGDLGDAVLILAKRGEARDDGVGTQALTWGQKGATYTAKPVPVSLTQLTSTDGKERVALGSVRVVKRRGFQIVLQVLSSSADKVRAAFISIVQSFDTLRTEAPDVPDDYKRVTRDGCLYLLEPSVAESEIAPVHRVLTGVASSLLRRYGPLPKTQARAIVVVLVPDIARAEEMCAGAKGAKHGVYADFREAVLYAAPLPTGDQEATGHAAQHCAFLLLSQYFGLYSESWLLVGESLLAASEACTGKPPPVLYEVFAAVLPKSLPELRDITGRTNRDQRYGPASFVYAAFFRSAGKPYSDAFAAYIKELRGGADPDVVAGKTILALDQAKLRSAAEAYMATLKPFKAK
jgi:hypothetical protein